MPPANQDRRGDVLRLAKERGWAIDSDRTRHGALSDQFTKDRTILTCFWSATPWSEARWDSGLLVAPDGARQIWRISGDGGVLSILSR